VVKFRRLKSVGYVARMGQRYMHTEYWRSNLKERDNLEDVQQVVK